MIIAAYLDGTDFVGVSRYADVRYANLDLLPNHATAEAPRIQYVLHVRTLL